MLVSCWEADFVSVWAKGPRLIESTLTVELLFTNSKIDCRFGHCMGKVTKLPSRDLSPPVRDKRLRYLHTVNRSSFKDPDLLERSDFHHDIWKFKIQDSWFIIFHNNCLIPRIISPLANALNTNQLQGPNIVDWKISEPVSELGQATRPGAVITKILLNLRQSCKIFEPWGDSDSLATDSEWLQQPARSTSQSSLSG